MKKTTYIMISMLAAGFIAISSYIAYLHAHSVDYKENIITVEGAYFNEKLPDCKVVKLIQPSISCIDNNNSSYISGFSFLSSKLTVTSSQSEEGFLSLAEGWKQHLVKQIVDDTLILHFNISENILKQHRQIPYSQILVRTSPISLFLSPKTETIHFKLNGLPTYIQNIQRDSMTINAKNNINIKNCHFGKLDAQIYGIKMDSTEIQDLYMDLDIVSYTNTKNSHIHTAHLTGRRQFYHPIQVDKYDRIEWTPLTPQAEITIELKGAASIEKKNKEK